MRQPKTLAMAAHLLAIGALLPLQAQQAPASAGAAKEFEVASIKPSDPAGRGTRIQMMPGGRFTATGITVRNLIEEAYDVKGFQISGAPGWLASDRFDINAKGGEEVTGRDHVRPMLQALLAERFKLTIHRETKELPSYALVVAKNGPKLTPSIAEKGPMMRMGRGSLDGQKIPLSFLASNLSNQLTRPVVDNTGLTGEYDIKLTWTPDQGQGAGALGASPEAAPVLDSTGPSLVTALQEQLGLKLEARKSTVEIIVIDKVEKPAEN